MKKTRDLTQKHDWLYCPQQEGQGPHQKNDGQLTPQGHAEEKSTYFMISM